MSCANCNCCLLYTSRQAIALNASGIEGEVDDGTRRERSIAIATSRNNLGIALYSLGRFEEAIEQYERVVELREVALGEHHPDVGAAYNNLANALMQIRRLDEARDEHARSMAIWKAGLGPEHPFIGASLNNLGNVEFNLGDFEAAEVRYREALALRLEVLPPDHVDLAVTRLNLGAVLTEREAYAEAQAFIVQANDVFERVLGEDHPYSCLLYTSDAPARLLREAQAMALLQHPNVVPVYDAGRSGGHVYLVMERLTGASLRRWLQPARPWQEIVTVFAAAGRGLAAAHAIGVVHRDFKPANVLVDEAGRVLVCDLSLIHISSASAT